MEIPKLIIHIQERPPVVLDLFGWPRKCDACAKSEAGMAVISHLWL